MPKRKKFPKLPNGYGSIKRLSGKRRNPFGVYPPATELIAPGQYAPVKALCYTDDWYKGFAVLTAYHAGNYYPGYERTLNEFKDISIGSILADYTQAFRPGEQEEAKPTFAEVYERYYKFKYEDSGKTYSKDSMNSTRAAFRNTAVLHDRIFEELRHDDLQKVVDDCKLSHASLELIVSLYKQMYAYADLYELVDKDHSRHVKIKIEDDDEHGVPYTDEEIKVLWEHKDNEIVEMLLIMIYSGYRIGAYPKLEINTKERYFKGGIKTKAGKERFVPIHSGIQDLVEHRLSLYGCLLPIAPVTLRHKSYDVLEELGIEKHTPHDCRHTFSTLCERYRVSDNDRKRMLGHKFDDVTNEVYGHRSVEDLRKEIEKIKICR